nr:trehalose-phosphatase [Brevibacterium renqingii]
MLRPNHPIAPTSPKRPVGPPISPPPARSRRVTRRPAALTPALSTPAEVDLRELITADSLLIALDFDGVLAPLQDDPETSRMVPESAAAITALAELPHTRVALVSGRDIATLRRLTAVGDAVWLIGSHGAEAELGRGAAASRSPDLSAREEEMLAAIDAHILAFEHTLAGESAATGFRVEAKPYSRTVHTRGFDPVLADALHEHAIAVAQEYPDIRIIEGHDITELAVKQATKGDGVRLLFRAEEPTAMAYLGDDVTDEDAFTALKELSADSAVTDPSPTTARTVAAGLTVKVGRAPTGAAWRIADPGAVALLLARLATSRAEHLGAPLP